MIGRRRAPCWALALALSLQQAEPLSTTTLTAPTPPASTVQQLGEFNVAQLQEYEGLRGRFDRDKILGFLAKRPWTVAGRLAYVSRKFLDTKTAWESQESLPEDQRTRGAMLNAAMAGLGPVSVKVGQTLSQRPDLVGEEACEALKSLQTKNRPFSNKAALQSVAVEFKLNSTANVAPNIGGLPASECLFASFSEEPAAAASLGQVYKARTHDNREVAVKVQRPDALRTVAIDYTCFAVVWKLIERWWSFQRTLRGEGPFDNGDIGDVVDTVADGLFDELDYDLEALNADRFRESLDFLGFVDVPTFLPELSTNRVLTTEWIRGAHLEALSVKDGALMTQLAVEACTASLVLTGYVHADPHEGNLMLREDGKVVFLDFGLMSGVDGYIMESFAQGIRACLAEDYESLARAFQDVGFLTTPLQFRENPKQAYELYDTPNGLDQFANELREAMATTEGGTSRFGALAEVLNGKLSKRWKMFTPPYCLLLIRTFLTLEGIAAQVDPDFNIYEMALPFALRRSLAPSSKEGVETLRRSLLTDDDRIKWDALMSLIGDEQEEVVDDGKPKAEADVGAALTAVVGSSSGAALRKAIRDVDAADLAARLVSRSGRDVRRRAALSVAGAMEKALLPRRRKVSHVEEESVVSLNAQSAKGLRRASSPASRRLRHRQKRWQRRVVAHLVRSHISRQIRSGRRGLFALAKLSYLGVRIMVGGMLQFLWVALLRGMERIMPGFPRRPAAA